MCLLLLILVSSFSLVYCDISHLFKKFNGFDDGNHLGYNYDPPSVPATILFPQTTPPPFQLPEIIVNQAILPSNVYLPPPVSSPLPIPIQPPLADEPVDSYLPPDDDDDIPHTPPVSYLPPLPPPQTTTPIPNFYLPPQTTTEEIIHDDGYHYDQPAKLRLPKNQAIQTPRNGPLRIEMNDLRCMLNRNSGYFKANLNLSNITDTIPVIDIDSIDKKCNIQRSKRKFSLDIHANDFKKCGIYVCSDKELCIRLRFPTIAGMKSVTDALLTLQCKLQEKIAVKTHAVRFGVADTG